MLQVYPKTEIGRIAKECGMYNEDEAELPASFFHKSVLEIEDRKKVERLRDLFLIIVVFPILHPFVKFLIRLPLDKFYYFADKVLKGYCNKHRIYPYKLTFKEYIQSLIIYFKADYY